MPCSQTDPIRAYTGPPELRRNLTYNKFMSNFKLHCDHLWKQCTIKIWPEILSGAGAISSARCIDRKVGKWSAYREWPASADKMNVQQALVASGTTNQERYKRNKTIYCVCKRFPEKLFLSVVSI